MIINKTMDAQHDYQSQQQQHQHQRFDSYTARRDLEESYYPYSCPSGGVHSGGDGHYNSGVLPPPPPPPLYPPSDEYSNNDSTIPPMPQTVTHFDSMPLLSRGVQGPPQQTEAVRQLLQFINVDSASGRGEGASQATSGVWPPFFPPQPNPAGPAPPVDYSRDGALLDAYGGCGVTVTVEGVDYNFQLTEDDIEKVFQRYGDLRRVQVLPPDNNTAQVEFFSPEAAQNAIAGLDGKVLNGVQGVLRVVWGLHAMIPRLGDNVESTPPPPPVVNTPPPGIPERLQLESTSGRQENEWMPGSNPGPSEGQKYNRLLTEWDVQNFFEGVPEKTEEEGKHAESAAVTEAPVELPREDKTSPERRSSSGASSTGNSGLNKAKMEDNVSKLLDEDSEASASPRPAVAGAVPNSAGKGLLGDGASLSQGLQRSVSGGSGASPGRQSTAGGPPIRKYTCRFDIGIENDREFQVARRIIGQKGANMKKIVGMSNAKLRLRGQGSGYLEGAARVESPDPLHLCISCLTKEGYDKAVAETAKLLKKVYSDWRDFNVKKHRGDPGFLELQMKEQFLVGGQGGTDGGNHHNNSHHYNGGNYRSSGGGRGGGSWGRSKENSSSISPNKRAYKLVSLIFPCSLAFPQRRFSPQLR
ncbi:hypothetical protein FOZ62_006889 [Perkinsus olseni]|uniref:RRM domain-containing protein n=1 Tax=Perkinsus olseni TaxID=32597 RepID=A0A7J6QMN1_PEROL|nr:hypothetical protein FOZ62_006889 [Perkinsus olseni]